MTRSTRLIATTIQITVLSTIALAQAAKGQIRGRLSSARGPLAGVEVKLVVLTEGSVPTAAQGIGDWSIFDC